METFLEKSEFLFLYLTYCFKKLFPIQNGFFFFKIKYLTQKNIWLDIIFFQYIQHKKWLK